MYIYESHLGKLYTSEDYIDEEELYCEACCDSDILIGKAKTKEEARKLLEGNSNVTYPEQINEIINLIEK